MVPAWLIAAMALFYTVEYVYRFIVFRNYVYLGKAIARFVLTGVYVGIAIYDPGEAVKQVDVRLSIFLLLFVDLLYIGQEHFMRRLTHK